MSIPRLQGALLGAVLIVAVPVAAQPEDFCAVARDKVASDQEPEGAAQPADASEVNADSDIGEPSGEDGAPGTVVDPGDSVPAGGLGFYSHEDGTINLFEDWRPPVVQHLTMHQFTAKYMGWASNEPREMRALFEGLAMVMERLLDYQIGPPEGPTLADSLSLPGWTGICDAGKQVAQAFDKIAAATSRDLAKDVFVDAVKTFKDLDEDGEASFAEFSVALIRAAPGFEFTQQVVIAFDDMGVYRDSPPEPDEGGTTPPS